MLSRNDTREERQLGQVIDREKMIRAMRLQIWTGAILGGLAAAMVGAIFLFVVSAYLALSGVELQELIRSFITILTTCGKTQRIYGREASVRLLLYCKLITW